MTRYTPLWEQAGSYAAGIDRRLLSALWPAAATTGLAVTATSGMVLAIAPGTAAVPSSNNTGSLLCVSDAIENVTLTAAPAAGNSRIDIVYVQPRANDIDGGPNNDFIFAAVAGAAATGTPTPPTLPAGALALANVAVGGGVAAIVAANITDQRPGNLSLYFPPASAPRGTLAQAVATAGTAAGTTVDWVTAPAVTVDGTRRIKITAVGMLQASAAGQACYLLIREGATNLAATGVYLAASGGGGRSSLVTIWEGVPAAGTHTYKSSVNSASNVSGYADAQFIALILVEDIGT